MKPSEVVRCLQRLLALYPAKAVTPDTLAAYAAMLCDLDVEQLNDAIVRHAATNRHWPQVSELRALAVEDVAAPLAEAAWGEVIRACSSVGRNRMPEWSHPTIGEAVEAMGGWQEVCSDNSGGVLRAHFYRTFTAYTERRARDANYAGLPQAPVALKLVKGQK